MPSTKGKKYDKETGYILLVVIISGIVYNLILNWIVS